MHLLLEDLAVTLGSARIVEDLTLSCAPGTVVGLLGPNGCGKSTVLKTVYRALRPTSGAVRLDGLDTVSQLSPRQSAQRVAALAQETHGGFDVCVQDLVAMGRTPHQGTWARDSRTDRDLVDEALRTVGMAAHAGRLFDQLSGGEKQRVLLARALAQQPRVLVLDEPTNHLDVSTQLQLLDLVRSLGITVLAALHDLNLAAAYCDQVHLLQEGRLVAHGTPHEVLTPALIARVFGVRADRLTHPATGRLHLALSPIDLRTPPHEGRP